VHSVSKHVRLSEPTMENLNEDRPTLNLENHRKYPHKLYNCQNLESLGCVFVADSVAGDVNITMSFSKNKGINLFLDTGALCYIGPLP